MKIKPLYDRIIVKQIGEDDHKTPSGLFVLDSSKDKHTIGEVIAVGNGRYLEDGTVQPLETKAGDRILFNKGVVQEVKLDNEPFYVMRESDIVGIIS